MSEIDGARVPPGAVRRLLRRLSSRQSAAGSDALAAAAVPQPEGLLQIEPTQAELDVRRAQLVLDLDAAGSRELARRKKYSDDLE